MSFRAFGTVPLVLSLFVAGCQTITAGAPGPAVQLPAAGSHSVSVDAALGWHDTGLDLRPGDRLRITARGRWSMGALCGDTDATGRGAAPLCSGDPWGIGATGSTLIGMVGQEGQPFRVGDRYDLEARNAGRLFLSAYDLLPFDNAGSILVTLERPAATPAASGAAAR